MLFGIEFNGPEKSFIVQLSGGYWFFIQADDYTLDQSRDCKLCGTQIFFEDFLLLMKNIEDAHKFTPEELDMKLKQRWKEPRYTLLCSDCFSFYELGCVRCGNKLDWGFFIYQLKIKPDIAIQLGQIKNFLKDNQIKAGILCCDCYAKFNLHIDYFKNLK